MTRAPRLKALIAAILFALPMPAVAEPRIRDIVDVEGVRENDLVGYGIVVGLNGTGDSVKNSPFTEDSLSYMLERLGVNVQGEDIKPKNVAAVLVTATFPSFARNGSTIDVTVASIGDAKSLEGSIIVSGINVQAAGASESRGSPTTGGVPNGARVEREINYAFNDRNIVTLALRNPDFTTAARIEETINKSVGFQMASMRDSGTIDLDLLDVTDSPSRVLASIENLSVAVSTPARIVIDEKSGTIVLGEDVTISKVAIAQGNISIKIVESPIVSQPNPFSQGETTTVPRSQITIGNTGSGNIAMLDENVSLSQLITGLNALGVSPQEMADIIRAMKAAGAIHAELVVR